VRSRGSPPPGRNAAQRVSVQSPFQHIKFLTYSCCPTGGPKEVIPTVSEVKVREGETFESALRRFNKKIKQNGVLSEVRRREHYEKPSVRRKRKLVAAKKRRAKAG
jgi:small subunit ribosomal protein S21